MRKPRALRPGDRIAIVAPASPFDPAELDAGAAELRALGFEAEFDDSVFERTGYTAGSAETRAQALLSAWRDPSISGIVAARGGYGSVHLLPHLARGDFDGLPKAFIAYSDNTSLLAWLTTVCGVVTFHGPMIDRRFSRGREGYDRETFERVLMRAEPAGEITHPQVEVIRPGEASGMLVGGTLTQLAASLGTAYTVVPPDGCVLFLEDVSERPYRVDRLLTQLEHGGILGSASAIVFGEMRGCEEPSGSPRVRDVISDLLHDFEGPVLFGLPSGHTSGPTLTLPFGVRARVSAGKRPALVIEEAAVV